MMRIKLLLICLVALLAVSSLAFAQDADPELNQSKVEADFTGPMNLERAVMRALKLNPGMKAIRAQLRGSEYGSRARFGNFLPSASGRYGYTYKGRPMSMVSGRHGQWAASLNIRQPLFHGFNILAAWQKAKLLEESNRASLHNVELTLIASVQTHFLSLLKARMDVKSAEDSVARLESQLKVISAFYDVGLRPKAEVLDAEVDLASARQILLTARNVVSTEIAGLNTLLNIPLEAHVDYVGALKHIPFDGSLQDCLKRAYASRPDLVIGEKTVAMANADSTMAASSFYPTIDANLDYYNSGVGPTLRGREYYASNAVKEHYTVGVQASMSLFRWGADYYTYKQTEKIVDQVKAQLEELRLKAGFEVKTALLNINGAADRITVAQKSVDAGQEAYRMAVARYQAQVGTNTDVLNAQSRLTTSEAQLSQALADYGTAVSRLYVAMGEKNLGLTQAD